MPPADLPPARLAWLPESARPRVFREAQLLIALYLTVLVVPAAFGFWWVWLLWALPRLAGEPVQRVIRLAEHTGLPLDPDPAVGTRSLATTTPLRWLAWNMPLHAEHHALPSVPFHALPALARCTSAPQAGGYLAAHVTMWRQLTRDHPQAGSGAHPTG